MTKPEELDTWKKWKKTQDPMHMSNLMRSMDPFLQSQVNRFAASPLPRPAIESQARVLAYKAFTTYDPKKGAALNTHVGNELKHLTRYVLEFQNVGKIPENRGIAISKYNNIKANLVEDLNREPTVLELSDALQWSSAEVERMQSELRQDLSIIQGKDEAFFDTLYNQSDKTRNAVEFVYYSSSPVEQKILEYWFGIGGSQKISTEQMAIKLGKSIDEIKIISKDLAKKIKDTTI
jgi:DNA-directed RNA polymerase sigma subunit (sigma70/sigma32)